MAFGCCAYVRWKVGDDEYESRLVMAKNRIAPRKALTVPRLELCGAVLGVRLRTRITSEMRLEFKQVYHIVDSVIVQAQIQKESRGFVTFVGTKIGECQRKSNPSEWWWGPREHNPADMTTRVTPAEQLNEPKWQTGAEYLTKPVTV